MDGGVRPARIRGDLPDRRATQVAGRDESSEPVPVGAREMPPLRDGGHRRPLTDALAIADALDAAGYDTDDAAWEADEVIEVDDLDGVGEVAKRHGLWFHIDGAYGLAGILAPSTRELFVGSERADSFIVDPHKWLFAPFDACALVYRNPKLARAAHTQHGEYLDTLTQRDEWNPSDYAYNLTRRVRGLPLWFSLATHGTRAYSEAVEANIQLAHRIADEIRRRPNLSLVREPQLSVVVFERHGWEAADYERWSAELLDKQIAFVVPSSHAGDRKSVV